MKPNGGVEEWGGAGERERESVFFFGGLGEVANPFCRLQSHL